MKRTIIAVTMAAGGLLAAAGPAHAVALCSTYTTVGAWAAAGSCVDVDSDSLWTYVSRSATFDPTVGFSVSELDLNGVDLYGLDFTWVGQPLQSAATISYVVASLNDERFVGVNFDTTVQGEGAIATKQLFDIGSGSSFITLTSVNGSRVPQQGEIPIGPRSTFTVLDTFTPGTAAGIFGASNSFEASVPEPGTLALLGMGLASLGLLRRRRSI